MADPTGPRSHGTRQVRPLLRTILGGVLRRIRLRQQRTLADVATAAQVSMAYLSELERGRKEASSEVLAAVCAALGVDLADVLAEVGRELVTARDRSAPVVRIDAARQRSVPPGHAPSGRLHRPDDATCLLVA